MSELSHALRSLVEHPPAPAPPLHAVAARSRRFRVRSHIARMISTTVVIGLVAAMGFAIARPKPVTIITVGGPGPHSAGYIAEKPGGYEGQGNWKLTILRGTETIELTSANSSSCGPIGTIKPGDKVTGIISDPHSLLRAGEEAHC